MRRQLFSLFFVAGCFEPICGDGLLQDREECDQGNLIDGDGCDAQCQVEPAVICGDDVRVPPEECDDGNLLNGDGCSAQCLREVCGDGIDNNRDTEECDDGDDINGDGCDDNCSFSRCGNSVTAPDEACDDGNFVNTDGCSNQCTLAVCGDNIVQSLGEVCDDGDPDNDDLCLDTCQPNQCGDGFLSPVEECDDGGLSDGDGCSALCVLELTDCGDGIVAGDEACDDGNASNEDDCLNSCQLASCGDSFVQSGGVALEECDDGDREDADNCTNVCLFPKVREVRAGAEHVCAVTEFDEVRCWGRGDSGQLGNGLSLTVGDNERPALLEDVFVGVVVDSLSVGGGHSCVLYESFGGSAARCWGENNSGQLGNNSTNNFGDAFGELPALLNDIARLEGVTQIAAGATHTCAVMNGDSLKCWGDNVFGQLGYGDDVSLDEPGDAFVVLSLDGADIGQVALGVQRSCVVRSDGEIFCWGLNASGELGYGDTVNRDIPEAQPIALGGSATQMAAGDFHSCARLADGAVKCWGDNAFGQLGYGDLLDRSAPALESILLSGSAVQVTAGSAHTCALLEDGALTCWGRGQRGQLGYGNSNNIGDDETPDTAGAVLLLEGATQISAAGDFTCARLESGAIQCWGDNSVGQLGYGNTNNIGDDETPDTIGVVPLF